MADNPLEQVLLEMGIDLSPVQKGGKAVVDVLTELNKLSDQFQAKSSAAGAAQLDTVKQIAKLAVQAALAAVAEENKKLFSVAAQTKEYTKQAQEQKASLDTTRSAVATEQARLDTIKAQTAALASQTAAMQQQLSQLQALASQQRGATGGGTGGGFLQNLLGGGSLGSIAAGGLAFGGAGIAIEAAVQGLEHFITKLKTITIESSKLSQVDDIFQRLAKGSGIDANQMLSTMQRNTDGLVSRFTLTKIAVAGLSGTLRLSQKQIEDFVGNAVKLAEAHGRPIDQAINAAQRMLESGIFTARIMSRSFGEVITPLTTFGSNISAVEKKALIAADAIKQLTERVARLGEMPQTVEQMIKRLDISWRDLLESFGKGVNRSAGMQVFIQMMHDITDRMNDMVGAAQTLGQRVGDSFMILGVAVTSAIPVAKALWEVIKQIFDIASAALPPMGVRQLADAGSEAAKKFRDMHPVITGVSDAIIDLSTQIQIMLLYLQTGLSKVQQLAQHVKDVTAHLPGLGESSKEARDRAFGVGGDFFHPNLDASGKPKTTSSVVGPKAPTLEDQIAALKRVGEDAKKAKDEAGAAAQALLDKARSAIDKSPTEKEDTKKEKLKQIELELAYQKSIDAIKRAAAQHTLQQQQNDIADEQRANDDAYSRGIRTLEEHLAKQHALAVEADSNKRAQLLEAHNAESQDLEAKEKELRDKGKENGDAQADIEKQVSTQVTNARSLKELEYQDKILTQTKSFKKQQEEIDKKGDADKFTLLQDSINKGLAAQKEAISTAQALNEKQFATGAEGPQQYIQARLQAITDTATAEIAAGDKVLASAKQLGHDTAKLEQETQEKRVAIVKKADDDIAKLREDLLQKTFQVNQKNYQAQQQPVETRIGYSRTGTVQDQAQLPQLLAQMQNSLIAQRSSLSDMLNLAKPYPDLWFQIYGAIEKTYQSQVKYNEELKKMADLVGPISQGLTGIGKGIGEVFTSKFAQNLAGVIQSGAQEIGKSTERGNIIFGRGGTPKDPAMVKLEEEASQLFSKVDTSGTVLVSNFDALALSAIRVMQALDAITGGAKGLGTSNAGTSGEGEAAPDDQTPQAGSYGTTPKAAKLGQSFDTITKQVIAAADALVGFITTLTQSKSAISGVIGGGLSGAGFGSMFTSLIGPIGTVIGAGIGAALGGIIGSKNAAVKEHIDQMNTTYKTVMNEFSQNTNNLQSTITQIQLLLQQARQLQAKSKKGSSEYQKAIDQYVQEVQQLQTQQLQIIRDMNEQLAVLSAPVGIQSTLNDLKGILEQYQKFEGAAQTVDDLARAHQFLTESVQQYEQNLETQLAQDNTQAINDALKLNDLLYQRSQILLQYNNQVQGVLSQGVLTRQLTRAQTAGQQIQQLTVAFNRQMEQMNEEISATRFKVQAEGQIFNLATTRVGLETQLLLLQNDQTKIDMQRIAGLSALVAQLQAGDYTKGALGALLAAIPTVSNPIIGGSQNLLQALMGIAAEATNSQLAQSFEDMVAASYQDRATLGYGAYQGQNIT